MDTFMIMLKNVLIFVLLAVPGYLLVRGKILTAKESGTLSKLLTNIGMPFLILSSALKLEFNGELTKNIILIGVLGIVFILFMFFSTALFCRDKNERVRGMMRFCAIFANNGFIGIPLVAAVFGSDSIVMAYIIILNILNNVLMFTLGVYLVSGDKKAINVKKALLNPVLLAFLAGIALNLLGINKFLPELQTYATHFSGIVTPLSMLVLGMKLAEVPMKKLLTSGRMYYVSGLRLVLYPALAVGVLLLTNMIPVLNLGTDGVLAFFVAYAMPVAGLASAFADQYGGDGENAVILTLGSTVLSVATIPVLYWILRLFV
jgi:predicted permease